MALHGRRILGSRARRLAACECWLLMVKVLGNAGNMACAFAAKTYTRGVLRLGTGEVYGSPSVAEDQSRET